jgi:hypothetical protein
VTARPGASMSIVKRQPFLPRSTFSIDAAAAF